MGNKALVLRLRQPIAHYRNPKFNQNDFIPTLNLPPKTTIMGFLTYTAGRRIRGEVDIGVIGTYKDKGSEFIRGENIEFYKNYRNLVKGKDRAKYLLSQEYYDFNKEHCKNTILRHEVLREVNLTIFIKPKDEEEFKFLKEALNAPKNYMALGRKEDFVVPLYKGHFVEEIELQDFESDNIREMIKNGLKLKNTYIKVDLSNENYDELLIKGEFLSIPSTYKDLNAPKSEREYVKSNYIYINSQGVYPKGLKVNLYRYGNKNEVFLWM